MVRSDKSPQAEVNAQATSDEGQEIDRIMKEIDDLEKQMDAATGQEHELIEGLEKLEDPAPQALASGQAEFDAALAAQMAAEESVKNENVVALRPLPSQPPLNAAPRSAEVVSDQPTTSSSYENSAKAQSQDNFSQPHIPQSHTKPEGGLSLKIGACTDVTLEFARAGISVTLACNDEGLKILTDQGAEFKIPFKKTA